MAIQSNLPISTDKDSSDKVKSFFDRYFQHQITFPAAEVDAVIGFFLKRGFEESSAKSISIIMLQQARLEDVKVFQILDSLKSLTEVQLNQVVAEIINSYRENSSLIGFKVTSTSETTESRNIVL